MVSISHLIKSMSNSFRYWLRVLLLVVTLLHDVLLLAIVRRAHRRAIVRWLCRR